MHLNRTSYVLTLSILLSMALLPGAIVAQGTTVADDIVWIHPEDDVLVIDHAIDLFLNDTGTAGMEVVLQQSTVHGTVALVGDTFVYTPSASFWSLGSDSFAYGLQLANVDPTGVPPTATVRIFHQIPRELAEAQGFEPEEDENYTTVADPGHSVTTTASAALVGALGLDVAFDAAWPGIAAIRIPNGDTTDGGGSVMLGGGLNQGGGGGRVNDLDVAIWTIGPASNDPNAASARVVMSESLAGLAEIRVEIRDVTAGTFVSSPRLPFSNGINHLNVEWWKSGALVDLNGETVRVSGVPNTHLDFGHVTLGVNPIVGSVDSTIELEFDQVQLFKHAETPQVRHIAGDGFESATLNSWSHVSGNAAVTGFTSLAPTGQQALEIDLDVGSGCVVQTDPDAELELSTRMRLDISEVLLDAGSFDIVDILNFGLSAPDVKLQLSAPFGETLLAAKVVKDGSWAHLGWYPLVDEHVVELQVFHSPAVQDDSGYIRLWIDGTAVGAIYGTSSWVSEWICLGALGVGALSGGELVFDDVDVWR